MVYEVQPGDRQTDRQLSISNRVPFLPKGYGTLKIGTAEIGELLKKQYPCDLYNYCKYLQHFFKKKKNLYI